MKTTPNQRNAINALKRALKRCGSAGVQIFGMDYTLYATTSHDHRKDFHQQYQEANGGDSDRIEEIVTGGVYVGSGGW